MEKVNPIFIGITRSFWLVIATIAVLLAEGPETVQALAEFLALVLPGQSVDVVAEFLFKVGPILTLVAAIHQRSHAARPYSLNPKDL